MLIHAYKQAIYMIPIVNQTNVSRSRLGRESARATSPPRNDSRSVSASSASSSVSTTTSESGVAVVSVELARGPLETMAEVLHVQDRLAASALIQFISLLCCLFQTFTNKYVAPVLLAACLTPSG